MPLSISMYISNKQSIIHTLTILTFHESNGLVGEPLFLFFWHALFLGFSPVHFLTPILTPLLVQAHFLNSFDKTNS